MLPFFAYPLAALGLTALPTLAVIYWLRNRFRRQPVSSLMLWADQMESREGGTRRDRLRPPLLFYLELLAILLLVAAAMGPYIQTSRGTRPLVVVLDDSYSMRAGGENSARNQGRAALVEELTRASHYSIRFVLAGERPQVVCDAVHANEVAPILKEWKCLAPTARLEESLALAAELGGERGLILVITDHAPEAVPDKGRVQWWAFGRPLPNFAFVNAVRTPRDGGERCLLEVANLSAHDRATTLFVNAGDPPVQVQRSTLDLKAGETRRVVLDLKEGTPLLRARLDPDDLEIDNEAVVLPTARQTVRVDVHISNNGLRSLVEKSLASIKGVVLSTTRPHLVLSDQEGTAETGSDAWLVRWIIDKETDAYVGPFVVDRAHPLTEGLALQGVIWSAGKGEQMRGAPVITAGNIPLVTDAASLTDHHELRIRFRPDLSTLQDSPSWPILLYNLVTWRAAHLPGLSTPNVRLGEDVVLTVPTARETVTVTDPEGRRRIVPMHGRRVVIKAEATGVYAIDAGGEKHSFAVNALSPEESDLSQCAAGRWGDWLDETTLRLEYNSIVWILLLLLLGLLGLHHVLIARSAGRAQA
jgi:hypothetical protein